MHFLQQKMDMSPDYCMRLNNESKVLVKGLLYIYIPQVCLQISSC